MQIIGQNFQSESLSNASAECGNYTNSGRNMEYGGIVRRNTFPQKAMTNFGEFLHSQVLHELG